MGVSKNKSSRKTVSSVIKDSIVGLCRVVNESNHMVGHFRVEHETWITLFMQTNHFINEQNKGV